MTDQRPWDKAKHLLHTTGPIASTMAWTSFERPIAARALEVSPSGFGDVWENRMLRRKALEQLLVSEQVLATDWSARTMLSCPGPKIDQLRVFRPEISSNLGRDAEDSSISRAKMEKHRPTSTDRWAAHARSLGVTLEKPLGSIMLSRRVQMHCLGH